LEKHGDARELTWLDEVLQWLSIYEIDDKMIQDACDVQSQALISGAPFPDMDLMIAPSAKSGSELLTLDANQLKMIEILKKREIRVSAP